MRVTRNSNDYSKERLTDMYANEWVVSQAQEDGAVSVYKKKGKLCVEVLR